MLVCMAMSLSQSGYPKSGRDIRIICQEDGMSGKEAADIQAHAAEAQEEFPDFTVWGEQQETRISNQDLGREETVSLITVCGDSRLVLDGDSWLDFGDYDGCLIDETLSWQLFGSFGGQGEKIQIGDRTYFVRGILDDTKGTVIVQAGEQEESLDKISVEIPEGATAEETVRKLSNQFGFSETTVNYEVYRLWGEMISLILPCVLGISVLAFMAKRIMVCRDGTGNFTFCMLEGILFLAVFLWILDIQIKIPGELLPTKWSDFEFWTELRQQKQEEFLLMLYGVKTKPEILYMTGFFQTLAWSGGAFVCWFFSLRSMRVNPEAGNLTLICCFIIIGFALLEKMGGEGVRPFGYRIVWLILPWYLLGRQEVCRELVRHNPRLGL